MKSSLNFRSPIVLTVIGVGATLGVTTAVVVVLLRFGGGENAVSDNAALIGGLIALGGVFTTQLVNISLEDRRAEQGRKAERTQRRRDRKAEQAQREHELAVAEQHSQDEALQAYLDQMGELLLNEDGTLYRSTAGDALQSLARSRTATVLTRLDGGRKGSVLQFLYEAGLILKDRTLVDLTDADLRGANLKGASLTLAVLSGADLSSAYLAGVVKLASDGKSWEPITNGELARETAKLAGATMPNGQKYEDWLKSKDRKENAENE